MVRSTVIKNNEKSFERFRDSSPQAWSSELRIVGPVFLVCGAFMCLVGFSLCIISRTISKDDVHSIESVSNPLPDTKYYMGLAAAANGGKANYQQQTSVLSSVSQSRQVDTMMMQPGQPASEQPNFAHPDTPTLGKNLEENTFLFTLSFYHWPLVTAVRQCYKK